MKRLSVPIEDARLMFDLAVESMDFGSGFLDDDEVRLLRRWAVAIGVDPIMGTPSTYARRMPHVFRCSTDCVGPGCEKERHSKEWRHCESCARPADQFPHRPGDDDDESPLLLDDLGQAVGGA